MFLTNREQVQMRRSNKILAAAPVSNSHETLANVAIVAVKAPTITLPKNGVSVLENIRPSHWNSRPSDTSCCTCKKPNKKKQLKFEKYIY